MPYIYDILSEIEDKQDEISEALKDGDIEYAKELENEIENLKYQYELLRPLTREEEMEDEYFWRLGCGLI